MCRVATTVLADVDTVQIDSATRLQVTNKTPYKHATFQSSDTLIFLIVLKPDTGKEKKDFRPKETQTEHTHTHTHTHRHTHTHTHTHARTHTQQSIIRIMLE